MKPEARAPFDFMALIFGMLEVLVQVDGFSVDILSLIGRLWLRRVTRMKKYLKGVQNF